jgi:hypothetical protein
LKRVMPALLLVVSATAALSASSGFVQAAEECRARPGSTAPAGSGWYYRINRADHRRCWFLMTKDAGAHVPRARHVAAESKGGVPQEQQADAQPQEQQADAQRQEQPAPAQPEIASSQTELADTVLPDGGTTAPQAAAPALAAATRDLVPRSIPTITFRRPSPDAQNRLQPTGETARAIAQTPARVDNSTPMLVVLAEVAATGLLFAGGGLFLTHLLRRRRLHMRGRRLQTPEVPRRAGRRPAVPPPEVPVVRAPPTASRLPNTTPVAADDLAQSIRELRHNLRRAEASIQRRFDERDFSNRAGEQFSEHAQGAFSHQMNDRGSGNGSLCALDESVEQRQSDE